MNDLEQFYEVTVSRDKMKAFIIEHTKMPKHMELTSAAFVQFLTEKGVTSGIDYTKIENLTTRNENVTKRVVIASGKQAIAGSNAYLQPLLPHKKDCLIESVSQMNLKDFLTIPSVSDGDIIGKKVKATIGERGFNVCGEAIEPIPGRDFTLYEGKNTRIEENEQALYSLIDGQISIDRNTIHVHPTFEVNGDLSMKTGNISFVGNVNIRGNVPSGFAVEAGGDIRVSGTVESATLRAGGSVFIGAGIVGQNHSLIEAAGMVQTTFINEGTVRANGQIEVNQAILHSDCTTDEQIICVGGKGLIVGGSLSAKKHIIANEIGNEMQTKTELFIGLHEQEINDRREKENELTRIKDEFMKLGKLLKLYIEKEKQSGELTNKEKLMKLRVLNSLQLVKKQMRELEQLQQGQLEQQELLGFVKSNRMIYPNVNVQFGKYRRNLISTYHQPCISLVDNEIVIKGV
ncbi:DUF342 domain-containing protein [Halalkalibacter okhensis]|uniref:Flagellar Assembly Protein A N-terminal region domain-containing protein n=1 Tax=Halalkalibacter okhensis TaxID=333138 RepID=A0A0B0IEM9_9BACI|nr:FapA family protein [Halalkalibacter okhensis]KHF39755.1 hypothetical protein LQ50_13015 [Halalkalibacter okhensis]